VYSWLGNGSAWPYLAALVNLLVSVVASSHALLNKRDVRSAIVWVGLIWLTPILGTLLYVWLGINRIQRRARKLGVDQRRKETTVGDLYSPAVLRQALPSRYEYLAPLTQLIDRVIDRPLLAGNEVTPLVNGDQFFPAMLDAVRGAVQSITLGTYIFDNDRAGKELLGALVDAQSRGVQVRVIIDDVGARYSRPSMPGLLSRAGIPNARFLPPSKPWLLPYLNLRSHRKLMVVDGVTGFLGGANIREGHLLALQPSHPVQDIHFRVTGPVVAHLQEVFADDWRFCTGEELAGEPWFVAALPCGYSLARGMPDGPSDDFETFRQTLLGALGAARETALICTPYFLPDAALITALNIAAMRGVSVDIVLPEKNNLLLVQWAAAAQLWQVLESGCRVWFSPPPFDHSKLFIVDGVACFVGSSNWDPRSLRLNFEFNLECYDPKLAQLLTEIMLDKIGRSRSVSLEDMHGRTLPIRLRDGIARLCSPFL
jgi:cardiolipin synthase